MQQTVSKADKEIKREHAALRKFKNSIQGVQKSIARECQNESTLVEQLSFYISLNSEQNIIETLKIFQESINNFTRLRQAKADNFQRK